MKINLKLDNLESTDIRFGSDGIFKSDSTKS